MEKPNRLAALGYDLTNTDHLAAIERRLLRLKKPSALLAWEAWAWPWRPTFSRPASACASTTALLTRLDPCKSREPSSHPARRRRPSPGVVKLHRRAKGRYKIVLSRGRSTAHVFIPAPSSARPAARFPCPHAIPLAQRGD